MNSDGEGGGEVTELKLCGYDVCRVELDVVAVQPADTADEGDTVIFGAVGYA